MEFEQKNLLDEPVTLEQIRFHVNNYLDFSGIPDLRSSRIIEKGNEFEAPIILKKGENHYEPLRSINKDV